MNKKQIEKLLKEWADGEVKAVDDACQKQLLHVKGEGTGLFLDFAREVCVCALRRGLRNSY